ncbi:MAG: hypothetical protein BWK76_05360 [Desulfobulbaceae bacterium A2]|nr:MAG: hypothetical protein BWK76_05360 [Desulfobulbaceae bacterium A2]
MRFPARFLLALTLLLCCGAVVLRAEGTDSGGAGEQPAPDPALLPVMYAGDEVLRYDINWTGGVKIGEMVLSVRRLPGEGEYRIEAKVRDHGLFRLVYPVDDHFVTLVRGALRLPYRYEVHQLEGPGWETKRQTDYDQTGGQVRYRKNEEDEQRFSVDGTVHNEFSSFFHTRAVALQPGRDFIVPTFADKKRHLVRVEVAGPETIKSILGPRRTLRVLPRMTFRGLYDKQGATEIWLTDDKCRIPLKIRSEILIGSLTSTLTDYHNPHCKSEGLP